VCVCVNAGVEVGYRKAYQAKKYLHLRLESCTRFGSDTDADDLGRLVTVAIEVERDGQIWK
jgi:hypothetical protein